MQRARVATAVLLAALVGVALPVHAQLYSFGVIVPEGGGTVLRVLASGGPQVFTYIDDSGNGIPDADEPVYLSVGTQPVATGDVRIAAPATGQAGSKVGPNDPDLGAPRDALSGQLAYLDADGGGAFSVADILYFDGSASGSGQVSIGDVILTGPNAGTVVNPSSPALNHPLVTYAGQALFHDTDASGGYSSPDAVYLEANFDGYVSVPDIRLAAGSSGAPSLRFVEPSDPDATLVLIDGGASLQVVYIDGNADGKFSVDEPAYFSKSTVRTLTGDIRVANAAGAPGSMVRSGDADLGNPTTVMPGSLAWTDLNGDGAVQTSETLYFDEATTTGTTSVTDIILSGPDAGQLVSDVSSHNGRTVSSAPGTLRFIDVDGDLTFSLGDVVYLDADSDGFVSPGDVQLSTFPATPADDTPPVVIPPQNNTTEDDNTTPPPPPLPPPSPPTGEDTQAREDAAEAKHLAEEARDAAERAEETAGEAKDAAEGARDAANENSALARQILESLDNRSSEPEEGVPGPGVLGLVLAGLVAAAVRRRRR